MNKAMRDVFGEYLLELGEAYPDLVVLDADIASSFRTSRFSARWPERHFNFGVAEQNMLMAAAGLSTVGLIPLACTFASFCAMRACEQIRSFICYGRLNVKIIATHGGLEVGYDGPTHQATEDIAIMRAMPNMTIIVPADASAVPSLLRQAVEMDGPVYFRMTRGESPVIYSEHQPLTVGHASLLRQGTEATIIATGRLVSIALEAAAMLANGGVQVSVLDMHTIKPLDTAATERALAQTKAIVTAEDHSIIGGLGGAVAEYLAGRGAGPLVRVGVQDTFARSGPPDALYERYGLGCRHLVEAVCQAISLREKMCL
jgi:transketolase